MARPTRSRPARGRSWDVRSLLPVALLGVVGAVGIALLASSLGWLDDGERGPRSAPAGTIAIPAAGVAIPTYTQIRVEHLVDPRTGDLRAVYLPEGSLLPETFIDAKLIVGRVLSVDKQPGQVFSESDFYPIGTREGIVAGIPAGKRALRIDATKVSGIVGLARGDRFDLIATFDVAAKMGGGVKMQGAGMNGFGRLGSSVRATPIVASGAVVQPLERRVLPGRVEKIVEEMVIAVDPEEVATLTEALHTGARIDCVPLSGRPEDLASERTDAKKNGAAAAISMIETISAGERRVVAVRNTSPALPDVSTEPPREAPPQSEPR